MEDSERGWRGFLAAHDLGRYEFERRHPDFGTLRLVAFGFPLVIAIGITIAALTALPPQPGDLGWWEGQPPPQGFPIGPVALDVGLAGFLGGLLAYGSLRLREDGMAGQFALAVGWGGPVVAVGLLGHCTHDAFVCQYVPGTVVLGVLWLILWLGIGLVIDYDTWSKRFPAKEGIP